MKAGDEILTNCFKKRVVDDPKCVLGTSILLIFTHGPPTPLLCNQLPKWTYDTLNCAYLCLRLKWAHKYFLNPRVLIILTSFYTFLILIFPELLFSEDTSDYSILKKKKNLSNIKGRGCSFSVSVVPLQLSRACHNLLAVGSASNIHTDGYMKIKILP